MGEHYPAQNDDVGLVGIAHTAHWKSAKITEEPQASEAAGEGGT